LRIYKTISGNSGAISKTCSSCTAGTIPIAISCSSSLTTSGFSQTSANAGASCNSCSSRAGSDTIRLDSNILGACASSSCIDSAASSSCFSAIIWKRIHTKTNTCDTANLSNSRISRACGSSVNTVVCSCALSLRSSSASCGKGASTSSEYAAFSGSAIRSNFRIKWASIYTSIIGWNISPSADRAS